MSLCNKKYYNFVICNCWNITKWI